MIKLLIDYRNFFALAAFLIAVDHYFYDMPAVIIVLCLCYFELTRIRDVIQSKLYGSDIKRFDKSFFEKGEDVVMPGAPPDDTIVYNRESKAPGFAVYTSKVLSGEIDPTKVSLMDFYTGVEFRKESVPYITNADNFQPGTVENEAEILHDIDTEVNRGIKKRVTENSTTTETRY